MSIHIQKYSEFIRFGIVGAIATGLHSGLYYLLNLVMNVNIAYTIGYVVALLCNFYLTAYKYMINYIRKMLEIDKERFYIYMEHVGNTVSSTIPIALCTAREEGKLHGNVMLVGFGVGLSWGAVLLEVL